MYENSFSFLSLFLSFFGKSVEGVAKEVVKFYQNLLDNKKADQYQYLGNCPPTPPLTQH